MEHINTLKQFDNLVASGVPEAQARAHVESLNSSLDHLATKEDLKMLEKDISAKISDVERDISSEIKWLKWIILGVGAVFAVPIIQNIFAR